MPFFDYQCPTCQTKEERMVKRAEDIQHCSKCNSEMKRLIGAPCFILKGKGWSSNGSFTRAKEGPKLDQDLLRLSDKELNYECGLPENCE